MFTNAWLHMSVETSGFQPRVAAPKFSIFADILSTRLSTRQTLALRQVAEESAACFRFHPFTTIQTCTYHSAIILNHSSDVHSVILVIHSVIIVNHSSDVHK